MSAISNFLSFLRSAIYAIDVRDGIADAIEQCYNDVNNPTLKTEALEAALQNKIDEGEMAALTIGDHTITAAKLAQGVIDNTLATSGAAADAKKTGDELTAIKADLDAQVAVLNSKVITDDIKRALLHCFENVAYANSNGMSAYNALYYALYGHAGNIWEWDSETSNEFMYRYGLIADATYDGEATIKLGETQSNRIGIFTSMYQLPVLDTSGERYSGYNLFPVPEDAGSVTLEFTPTANEMSIQQMHFTGDDFIYKYIANSGWKSGGKIVEPISTRLSTGLKCNALVFYYRIDSTNLDISDNPSSVKVTFHDYFDTWIYKYSSSGAGNIKRELRAATHDGNLPTVSAENQIRASFYAYTHRAGQAGLRMENQQSLLDLWLIPVPDEATSVKVTPTPATYYTSVIPYHWKENDDSWLIGNSSGWVQGVNNHQIQSLQSGYDHRYISINCKFNSGGTSGNAPTGLIVEFS